MFMDFQKALRQLIHDNETLVVPDAYDAISARIIQKAGFKAVQCSGFSISISKVYSDEKFVSLDENLSRTKEIASAVNIPVMADGEDGYGQGDLFQLNVRRFIDTGIAGINIEDQNLWDIYSKEKIVSIEIMIDKIKSVVDLKKALQIPNFLLNARTDAL
jgi:2-methylisocitrate lyase-like PEP mutase family enzyme